MGEDEQVKVNQAERAVLSARRGRHEQRLDEDVRIPDTRQTAAGTVDAEDLIAIPKEPQS